MLISSCRDGTVLHANLKDSVVEQDLVVGLSDADPYHRRDLRGCAMTNPESSYFYFGAASEPAVFEYEWHHARRITRRFMLPGFEHPPLEGGIQSLTWVPTDASKHQGYFYVGSHSGGRIFIYDLPLVEDTGPEAIARLVSVWTPLQGSPAIAGLSFSGNMLFVSYDQGSSNRVLVFEVFDNGLQGALLEQYEVDVPNGCGLAVRRQDATTWEAFFTSGSERAFFAYVYRPGTGFDLHEECAKPHDVNSFSFRVTKTMTLMTSLLPALLSFRLLLAVGVASLD